MRTTIDLPDTLFRELKSLSALQGTSLKDFIRAAVEEQVQKSARQVGKKVNFPILHSAEPGTLDLTNTAIDDLLA